MSTFRDMLERTETGKSGQCHDCGNYGAGRCGVFGWTVNRGDGGDQTDDYCDTHFEKRPRRFDGASATIAWASIALIAATFGPSLMGAL